MWRVWNAWGESLTAAKTPGSGLVPSDADPRQGANMSNFESSHRSALVAPAWTNARSLGGVFLIAAALLGPGCSADDDRGGGPAPNTDGGRQDGGAEPAKDAKQERATSDAASDATRDRTVPEAAPDGAPASCSDGVKNGSETDVDCGGPCAKKCDLGKTCTANADCMSGLCPQTTCVECIDATTCPGADSECQTRTCYGNTCGISNLAQNTPLVTQTAGDCKARVCDGNGAVTMSNDDTDVGSDNKECTRDLCSGGSPSHSPVAAGTACTENNGTVCDGNGACVACNAPADCGQDTECKTFTCNAHVCGVQNAPATKAISAQVAGDCKKILCDGAGGVAAPVADDTDLPVDGRECTRAVCTNGVPSNPPVDPNTTCAGGAKTCTGIVCGECDLPTDCTN